jgi:hypothetical protein
MNKNIQEVLASNTSASHVLFHNGMFVAFGGGQCKDFARIGQCKGIKGSFLYDGQVQSTAEPEYCIELFKKSFELSDPALIAFFRIAPWQVQFIQRAIKSINATHVILFGDDDGVFFNCFDALRFMPDARMNRGHETKVLTHQLKDSPSKQFHMTLNAASVMKLPRLAFDVGIGNNKIAIFTDDKSGDTYLLRDLEVSLPMVNFFSDRLREGISLSLVASSLFQGPGTSQPDSPEWEFDESDLVNQFVP